MIKKWMLVAAMTVAMPMVTLAADEAGEAKTEPTEVIEKMTSRDNLKKTDNGAMVLKNRAKPVENWFGCKPASDGNTDHCEAQSAKPASKEASQ